MSKIVHDLWIPLNCSVQLQEQALITQVNKDLLDKTIVPSLKCSKLLTFLINDILDMSQIKNMSFMFNFKKINIYEHIKQVFELLNINANMKEINYIFDYIDLPTHFNTDPVRLQ